LLHFTAARRQASFSRLAASSIQSTDTSSGRKAAKAVKAAKTLKEFWSFGVLSCFNSEFQWMPKHLGTAWIVVPNGEGQDMGGM
jgi:hypothetical protein